MKPRVTIGRATSPDGTELELIEHDGSYVINADGLLLMSTRMVHSEQELARLACEGIGPGPRVLIGGLGCGYTLRATLDLLPQDGTVVQAELVPELVEWNRGPLAQFADHPLDDPRTELVVEDVAQVIRGARGAYDAIMLDVDNGPSAVVTNTNAWLYGSGGLQAIRRALKPGGVVAIWSAEDDRGFPELLEVNGLQASRRRVRSREGRKGPSYVIFVGRKSGGRRTGSPTQRRA